MRDAIRRALASPPPRGAVWVVVVGLVITIVAIALSRDPGGVGEDVPWKTESEYQDSPTVRLGDGGEAKIVGGFVSTTADNDFGERLFKVEGSLRARAGTRAGVDEIRCRLRLPRGINNTQSDGRRGAFPRPLEDTADDAIKEGASIEFETDDNALAGVELRNAFFKYVVGGDPSVSWSNLDEGQHTWKWEYSEPVRKTRVNFAIVLIGEGARTVPITCDVTAGAESATASTSVRLPDLR
jgi:hypothetical protein